MWRVLKQIYLEWMNTFTHYWNFLFHTRWKSIVFWSHVRAPRCFLLLNVICEFYIVHQISVFNQIHLVNQYPIYIPILFLSWHSSNPKHFLFAKPPSVYCSHRLLLLNITGQWATKGSKPVLKLHDLQMLHKSAQQSSRKCPLVFIILFRQSHY